MAFTDDEILVIKEAERAGILNSEDKRKLLEIATQAPPSPGDDRPETLGQLTGGLVDRSTLTGAGSIVGGGVGAVAGGTAGSVVPFAGTAAGGAAGAVIGGGLGAAAGSAATDNIENALRAFGVLRGEQAGVADVSMRAAGEAKSDATFGMAGEFIRPLRAIRRIRAGLSGINKPEVMRLIDQGKKFGIDLSQVDVGGALPKGYAKVVGIFPLTGTPIRRRFVEKQMKVPQAVSRMLEAAAPNAVMQSELGVNMFKLAEGVRKEFVTTSARLYENFREVAYKSGDFVPTEGIRDFAEEVAEAVDEGRLTLSDGEVMDVSNEAFQYVARLAKLPGKISYRQYENVVGELEDLISKGKWSFDSTKALQAKKAFEQDLRNFDGIPGLKASLQAADDFYSKGIVRFQTPTARRFTRADRRLFTAGPDAPGSINPDELADVVSNLKSPQAIKDLRGLVGDEAVNAAARVRIQQAFDIAKVRPPELAGTKLDFIVDPDKFAAAMGLQLEGATGRQTVRQIEGLNELLRTSGISTKDIGEFVEVLRAIQEVGDPSTFVTRRVQLAGASAAFTALGVGTAFGGSGVPVGAIMAGAMARAGSSFISSPKTLRALTDVLRNGVVDGGPGQMQRALIRFVRATTQESEQE